MKLNATEAAGWNAGRAAAPKIVKTGEIAVDPEISNVFAYKEFVLGEITENMRRNGFDRSQPLAVWEHEERYVVLDGHTRLAAAHAAGIDEVPVVVMDFEDKDDAILYTFERQVVRRNLTSGEILTAVGLMGSRPGHKKHDGTGRSAEKLAARLGVGLSTIMRAQKVLREAPESEIEAVRSGEKTIGEAHRSLAKENGPMPEHAAETAKERRRNAAETSRETEVTRETVSSNPFSNANRMINEAILQLISIEDETAKQAVRRLEQASHLLSAGNKCPEEAR